jgi:hypothetical protein
VINAAAELGIGKVGWMINRALSLAAACCLLFVLVKKERAFGTLTALQLVASALAHAQRASQTESRVGAASASGSGSAADGHGAGAGLRLRGDDVNLNHLYVFLLEAQHHMLPLSQVPMWAIHSLCTTPLTRRLRSDAELAKYKALMEEEFRKNQLRPGDEGYQYDKQVRSVPAVSSARTDRLCFVAGMQRICGTDLGI